MDISNVSNTKQIVKKTNFKIKKKYGQNFLVNQNIISSIVDKANITKDTAVIEIGPGLGALTEKLLDKSGCVLAYEIDNELIPILEQNLIGHKNFKLLNQDILKSNVNEDIKKYLSEYKDIAVVANLPYYITTPILMGLLEQDLDINRYIVMMQKEVAKRITGKPSTKDYNSLSIAIQYKTEASIVIDVPREVFVPAPNVDSAVVRLTKRDKAPIEVTDEKMFFKIVKSSFVQRRKTLVNNLSLIADLSKVEIGELLESLDIASNVRAEALSIAQFAKVAEKIGKYTK